MVVIISLPPVICNFDGSYPGIFKWVGVTNGADGLSTMVNPVPASLLSGNPPSLAVKFMVKGKFLTTEGQTKELIVGQS